VRVFVTSKSFGRTAPDAIDLIRENGVEVVFAQKRTMTAAEIAAAIPGYDALIVGNDPVDERVLAAGDRLRLVHMHGTGLDAIDVAAASRRGILVANAPGVNRNAVAELTVALMLIAARSIDRHMESLKAGRWDRSAGIEVSGKTIGVLGLGNTGRRVVELLAGFGVKAVAFDVQPDLAWAASHGVRIMPSADEVFAAADFLILSLSLNADTQKIVDARRLALMKPTAILVNTARGGLIDEPALCAALAEKRIAGAALDAFDPEPLALDSPLRASGAVLTPHLAATSREASANVSRVVARNVVDVLRFGRADCAVNAAEVAKSDAALAR
jgi:phosphoglycerate dehydrogenase-like enzyme